MAEYIELRKAKRFFNNIDSGRRGCSTLLTPTEFAEYLDEIETADVAPVRHGRWETISDPEYVMKDFSCSACEELICDFDTTALWPGQNCYYYCPCCGAKMDGGTNA